MASRAYKMSQLRELDCAIVRHVIERGKMMEKREKLLNALRGTNELDAYSSELGEWLETMRKEPS